MLRRGALVGAENIPDMQQHSKAVAIAAVDISSKLRGMLATEYAAQCGTRKPGSSALAMQVGNLASRVSSMSQPDGSTGLRAKRPSAAGTGGLKAVRLRFEFYRDGFRWLVTTAALLAIAVIVQAVSIHHLLGRKPVERYFTVDNAGRVIPVKALSEPFVNPTTLATWAAERILKAYRLDPKNYVAQAEEQRSSFTPDGFEQYKASLVTSGTIELMTKRLLVMSATPLGTPVVVKEGVEEGVYYWKVRMPVLVDFQSATAQTQRRRIVEIVIVRRHTIEAPLGIGISQFVARDM